MLKRSRGSQTKRLAIKNKREGKYTLTYKLTALSLGAGVQSSTILLMACKGELPKPDLAIFADTGWESQKTYQHLEWLEKEAKQYGIPVIRVGTANIKDDLCDNDFIRIPYYCQKDGKRGQGRRRCTEYYKLRPIQKELRKLLGIEPRAKVPKGAIDLWIGISTDEASRVSSIRREQFIDKSFPLLTIKPLSRIQCISWLENNYPSIIVPKSACIGCPFHSRKVWQQIHNEQIEWQSALEVDSLIRNRRDDAKPKRYLHHSCQPLEIVDLRTPQEKGQLELPFGDGKLERIQLFRNMEL